MKADARHLDVFYAAETLGSPENAVGFMLWRLVHRFQRETDRALEPLGLTHLQFTTLAMVGWLNRAGREATQADLSRYADIQPMQISQIVTVLEAKGFIGRMPSTANPRAKCVSISRTGLAVLRRAMPLAIGIQQRLFGTQGRPGGRFLAEVRAMYEASMPKSEVPALRARRRKRVVAAARK